MNRPRVELPRGESVRLAPLVRSEDGSVPRWETRVELRDEGETLVVDFEIEDPEPRATLRERDAALWTEEVVEIFLAPGHATARRYFEIEVNPLGTLFDARIFSPFGDRREMRVDRSWDCPGLEANVSIDPARGWSACFVLPWASLGAEYSAERRWTANFFRIERPRDAAPEFSAWSPTGIVPADFHRPNCFGFLTRLG